MTTPRDQLYSSTFAVRKELKEPLIAGIEKIGVGGTSSLLTMIAERSDEVAAALAPIAAAYMADKKLVGRGKGKVAVAREALSDATDDEMRELLAELGVQGGPRP